MQITTSDREELRQHLAEIAGFCHAEIRRFRGRRTPALQVRHDNLKSLLVATSKCLLNIENVQRIEDVAEHLIGAARQEDAEQRARFEALPWGDDPAAALPELPQDVLPSADVAADPRSPFGGCHNPPEPGTFEAAVYDSEWMAVGGLRDGLVWLASSPKA